MLGVVLRVGVLIIECGGMQVRGGLLETRVGRKVVGKGVRLHGLC